MQEPRNSCAVVANTKESESRAVPAVASVVTNELFKKATEGRLATKEYAGYRLAYGKRTRT